MIMETFARNEVLLIKRTNVRFRGGNMLKKALSLLFIVLLCCSLLFMCKSEVKATFVGVIEEVINERGAFVYVTESENNAVYGIVYVNLAKNPDETFKVGDKVKVGYDGKVQGTAPMAVTTVTVELVE